MNPYGDGNSSRKILRVFKEIQDYQKYQVFFHLNFDLILWLLVLLSAGFAGI